MQAMQDICTKKKKKKRRHAMRTEDHHIVLALMAIPWITTGKSKQIDPKYKGNDKKEGVHFEGAKVY